MFLKTMTEKFTKNCSEDREQTGAPATINRAGESGQVELKQESLLRDGRSVDRLQAESTPVDRLRHCLQSADGVVIGAGSGLSTSAGFTYTGTRFEKYFSDFIKKYGFPDMYSGGFYPFETLEEHWAYWSRYIWINRYMDPPKPVYDQLYKLIQNKDYFVLTTNVDHCFQKAGFSKDRLFYTQGDYGLFQCSRPCHKKTYDNETVIRRMVELQGFQIMPDGTLEPPKDRAPEMTVPTHLIPRCPLCGKPMAMNLRADNTFVEDEGWHAAAANYKNFLREHQRARMLFLELGVGSNTPVIIKYPFWQMTDKNKNATYTCINYGEVFAPSEIRNRSICIDGDIGEVLEKIV